MDFVALKEQQQLELPDNPKQNCTQKNSKLFLAHVEQKIEVQKLDFGKKNNL
jgi:hypothetical protein